MVYLFVQVTVLLEASESIASDGLPLGLKETKV